VKIHHDIRRLPEIKNAVITIGSFDGFHAGHKKLTDRINRLASETGGESIVITFDPHPRSIIYPKANDLKLLTDLKEKLRLLEKAKVDHVVVVPFSIEFSQQSPQEYVENFILKSFNPRYIVIGYDHRFGLNRIGDLSFLKKYEKEGELEVVEILKQEQDNIAISSTKIREAIIDGDILKANKYLGHFYSIRGRVIHGKKIGSSIDFPTANLRITEDKKLLPAEGVYAVIAYLEETSLEGMMYIGQNKKKPGWVDIEVNLFDFHQDIYEEHMLVEIVDFVRDNEKFESLPLLKAQLEKDKVRCREILASNVSHNNGAQTGVNVAILNYNGLNFLESYLPFLSTSETNNTTISVIDNNSSDESVAYLKEWHPEVELIKLDKNYGFAEGYNKGIKHIDQKYTILLNSDVKVSDGWIEPLVTMMESDPSIIACQPKIRSLENPEYFEYAGAAGGFMDSWAYPFCKGRILENLERDNGQYEEAGEIFWTSGAAMIVRTELFKELGGFDGDYFAHQEEIDFCWRAKNMGYKCMYEPASIVYHLGGGTLDYGNSRKVFLNFRNNLITILKNERRQKLLWLFPWRLILDGLAGIQFLFKGQWKSAVAIIKAHLAVYGKWSSTWRKRKDLKSEIKNSTMPPNGKIGRVNKSIIWNYYVKGNKTYKEIG
jgi:riboflavin kinase/FMN adenylyltransferase